MHAREEKPAPRTGNNQAAERARGDCGRRLLKTRHTRPRARDRHHVRGIIRPQSGREEIAARWLPAAPTYALGRETGTPRTGNNQAAERARGDCGGASETARNFAFS